ncbi:DUF6479 family protein [Streptomyces nodosus]|uniref:DUF6479 family protein n=1 Tax=Streptomyces nodosus TaxID=40318 RepID=UPI001D1056DA|nr:DUF6479 family protein [Streptomyces nodosus]
MTGGPDDRLASRGRRRLLRAAGEETRQVREPDEGPRAEGESERLTPHQLRHSASRRSGNRNRRRGESGSSGSFGSGGSGGG